MISDMVSCLIISLLLSLSYRCVMCATLTVAPVSVTTAPFTSAEFTCEGTGNELTWLVGSALLTNAIEQQRDISVTDSHSGSNLSSVLAITALPVNDNVGIACWIKSFSQNVLSVPSTLTIRGVSSVEDLEISFPSRNSLNLTWSPPVFYSNDVPIGAPINYRVIITGEPTVDTTVSNTSITVPNITKCDAFNVSVTAFIAQYTSVSNSTDNNGSYFIDIENHSVTLNGVPILFRVSCTPSLCNGTVVIEPYCDRCTGLVHYLLVNGSDEDTKRLISYTLTDLEPFKHYNITVKIKDILNMTRDQDVIEISTYHVQGLIISSSTDQQQQQYTNGSVRVKCLFIEGGSTADGCHVLFSDTAQGIKQSFNITGTDEEIVTLSVSGNYIVTAYDLVNGTIIGPSLEYSTPVEVIVLPVPPPVSATSSISSSSSTMIPIATNQATAFTVSTTSDVSTVPRPTSESTDGKQQQLVIILGSTVVGGILLVLFVIAILVLLSAIFVRRNKMKQSVTLHGERAMTRNAQADQNEYEYYLPEAATASDHSQMIVASASFNGTDRLTQITPHENPYLFTREEFLDRRESSNSANSTSPLLENDTSPNSVESSLNISLHNEFQSNSAATGATVNGNMSAYADLATIPKERAPCKPLPATQSVTYSKVSPHTNKRVNSVHPAANESSNDPPPKYENLDHFTRPVHLTEEAIEREDTYRYFVEPSVSLYMEEDHCFVHKTSRTLQLPEEDNEARFFVVLTNEDIIVQNCSYRVLPCIELAFTDNESVEKERYFANEEIVEAVQESNTCKVEGQVSSSQYTVLSTDGANNDVTDNEIQQDDTVVQNVIHVIKQLNMFTCPYMKY